MWSGGDICCALPGASECQVPIIANPTGMGFLLRSSVCGSALACERGTGHLANPGFW